ncbi:MAG: hypothetical protein ABIE70_12595 [bacterium]
MTSDQHRHDSDHDRLLDRLVRAAREESEADFVRPSDRAITAYLMGEADERQHQEVTQALIASASFRKEILKLGDDLEYLTGPEAAGEFATLHAEESRRQTQVVPEPVATARRSYRSRIRELIWPSQLSMRAAWLWKGAVPVAAAILLAVISPRVAQWAGLWSESPTVARWQENGVMDPGLFVSNVPREAVGAGETTVYASHLEAAQAEFSRAIRYADGQFVVGMPDTGLSTVGPQDTILITLAGDDGQALMTLPGLVPSGGNESAQLWSVTPTDRLLRHLLLTADSVTVSWLSEYGRQGCLTITYPVDSGYAASPFVVFDL